MFNMHMQLTTFAFCKRLSKEFKIHLKRNCKTLQPTISHLPLDKVTDANISADKH